MKSCSHTSEIIHLEYDVTNLNNLRDILLYSPRSIDNNNEKILYIFYQLLKLYKYLHDINLNCNELKLSDIFIDTNFFIKIKLPLEQILKSYTIEANIEEDLKEAKDQHEIESIEWPLKQNIRDIYNSYR